MNRRISTKRFVCQVLPTTDLHREFEDRKYYRSWDILLTTSCEETEWSIISFSQFWDPNSHTNVEKAKNGILICEFFSPDYIVYCCKKESLFAPVFVLTSHTLQVNESAWVWNDGFYLLPVYSTSSGKWTHLKQKL